MEICNGRSGSIIAKINLHNNNSIPSLGLGTWEVRGEICKEVIKNAYDLGYRHFDTASFYGNQQEIAKGLNGKQRSSYFLTSKIWPEDMGKKSAKSLKNTLNELNTEYLDLLLIHWPDPKDEILETFETMAYLKEQGLVRNLGVSNFTINHIKHLHSNGFYPQVNQVEFHPFLYQEALLNFCQNHSIVLTAYCPLFRANELNHHVFSEIGDNHNKSVCQVMIRWILQKGLIAIPRSKDFGHLKENIDVFNFELSDFELSKIDNLNQNYRLVDPDCGDFTF